MNLKESDEVRIINPNSKLVMGPYTQNQLPSTTSFINHSSAIIEFKTNEIPNSSPFLIKSVAYGLKGQEYFLEKTLDRAGLSKNDILNSTLPCDENNTFKNSTRHYGCFDQKTKVEDFGENPLDNKNFEVDKLLRSVAIIIFESDGYINCATGTLLNSETCEAYIVTCNHCVPENTDFSLASVRFGWFRLEKGEPGFTKCDDYINNKSLINDNYTDYCGLDLVASSSILDYSLFKMHEKPNQDEYYSSWITSKEFPQDQVLEDLSYSITSVNYIGFPLRGNELEIKESNDKSTNWEPEKYQKAGWSGSPIFDSKKRLIGIHKDANSSIKFASIYKLRDEKNLVPKTLFDIDNSEAKGRLITEYNDGTDYVKKGGKVYMIEGEEAFIKYDQCNPRLGCKTINIEKYFELSKSSCEENACCFTLKFIDPKDLTESGENPVKIKFSNIDDINDLIGEDIINNDGVFQEGEELEFCLDNSIVKDGQAKFLMSFWDKDGNKICEKEVSLETDCKNACPEIEFIAHSDADCCWELEININESFPICHENPFIKYEVFDENGNLLSSDYTKESGTFTDPRWCDEENIKVRLTYLDEVDHKQIVYCEYEKSFECDDCCDFDIKIELQESSYDVHQDIRVIIDSLKCEFMSIEIYKQVIGKDDNSTLDTIIYHKDSFYEEPLLGLLGIDLRSDLSDWNSDRNTKIKYRFVFYDENGIACEKEVEFDFGEKKYGLGKESMFFEDEIEFSINPNPSNSSTSIEFNSIEKALFEILIYDIKGRLVYKSEYDAHQGPNQVMIETEKLINGQYNLMLKSNDFMKTKKLIVTH